MRCHPGDGELSEGRLPEADAGAEAERRTVSSAKKRWTAGKAPLQDSRSWKTLSRRSDDHADDHADDLGVERRFFLLAATLGAAIWNAVNSLSAGGLVFGVLYAAGWLAWRHDQNLVLRHD